MEIERGVYFDAWFPRQHCYHPSLPPRRLRMIEDLVDLKATVLVWAALGGGSLSLPYLEQEAFGDIDPRFRFYGFVNDAEFIRACEERGIKVFGVVFEVQGWEFPVKLNESDDKILALNEVHEEDPVKWLGLREFSQNSYPALWKSFETYFPEGLQNSNGAPVTDLLEECCSRDIYGAPCHAHWVECPDRDHYCYTMDRNNPVWREYLKAIVRIQIDAGVAGVHLDEAELPITSLQYGGCFCKDCMAGFREYVRDRTPDELAGVDIDSWHYGSWLLERGHDFKSAQADAPLFWDYLRFQQQSITRYFGELADYVRSYARSKGREVQVSGNFFNLFEHYYALEPKVDLVVTEMRNTGYRQPSWYRYVAGFAGNKPVVVVENPYGGVIPELAAALHKGRSYDLFRMSLYEAAALGANMSVPYGAWMGSEIQDSFHPPHDLCAEIQTFLADNEDLYSRRTYSEIGVIFSVESNFRLQSGGDVLSDNTLNAIGSDVPPFWHVCDALSDAAQPYDVIFFPDGELRADDLCAEDLERYAVLVLPQCSFLTLPQAALLQRYIESGGRVLALGDTGANLSPEVREPLIQHARWSVDRLGGSGLAALWAAAPQVRLTPSVDAAVNLQRIDGGAAVHLIRYDYDGSLDRVAPLAELTIEARLPIRATRIAAHGSSGELSVRHDMHDGMHRLHLTDVPLYCVIALTSKENGDV
ncbi:MAG: beta-galactosidase [Actinomycetota bacterium]|nr:beta-galactosidase [Actinomycetota bacterium]